MARFSQRSDAEVGARMANAIGEFMKALDLGKFRPSTGMAYIIESDLVQTPELGELSAAADEWSRDA